MTGGAAAAADQVVSGFSRTSSLSRKCAAFFVSFVVIVSAISLLSAVSSSRLVRLKPDTTEVTQRAWSAKTAGVQRAFVVRTP